MFIFCTLPNASHLINGIAFEPCPGGVVSADQVEEPVAEKFSKIPGYKAVKVKPSAEKVAEKDADKSSAGKKDGKRQSEGAEAVASGNG